MAARRLRLGVRDAELDSGEFFMRVSVIFERFR